MTEDPLADFHAALDALPTGYSRGTFDGAPWSVTLERSSDGRRLKLYGEALGGGAAGPDHVSFNLYIVSGEARLKPCEMPAEKVITFVLGYQPGAPASG